MSRSWCRLFIKKFFHWMSLIRMSHLTMRSLISEDMTDFLPISCQVLIFISIHCASCSSSPRARCSFTTFSITWSSSLKHCMYDGIMPSSKEVATSEVLDVVFMMFQLYNNLLSYRQFLQQQRWRALFKCLELRKNQLVLEVARVSDDERVMSCLTSSSCIWDLMNCLW